MYFPGKKNYSKGIQLAHKTAIKHLITQSKCKHVTVRWSNWSAHIPPLFVIDNGETRGGKMFIKKNIKMNPLFVYISEGG